MIDWRPFFPLETPRPQQAQALDKLCAEIGKGKRLLALEAGTGVGKSAIAVCLGRWLDAQESPPEGAERGTVVLVAQKVLQDQYTRDFSEARDLRSAANFKCHGPMGGTCGETWRVRKAVGMEMAAAIKCVGCPYREAKEAFKSAPLAVTNYSYHLSEAIYAGELAPRHLLVCDEAHLLEDEVRRWSSVEITEGEANEFETDLPWEESENKALGWLVGPFKSHLTDRLTRTASKLQVLVGQGQFLDKMVAKWAEENDKFDKRVCQINRLIQHGGRILISYHSDRKGNKRVLFQPLEVAGLCEDVLYKRSGVALLMSATLLDQRTFAKSAGLKDYSWVQIPTPFKPQQFGVHFRPLGKLTKNNIDSTLLKLPRALKKILKEHPNEKGIIHAHSYKIMEAIREVNDPRLLIQKDAADRENVLKLHLSSKQPTVLVGPAFTEGLDLAGDLGRFQVLIKIPYPSMDDPVVKHKEWGWYAWRAARALTQAAGRCVRSNEDFATTYVLDEDFIQFLERNPGLIPAHLIDGMEIEDAL